VTTTAGPERVVHVEHCMGTVFTIDIRDGGTWDAAVDEVVNWLHRVDAVFSTFRPDSDISRLRHGQAAVTDLDPYIDTVLTLCAELSAETGGYFSARTPDGLDPTGAVKGWAIFEGSRLLRARGSDNHVVSGGGDMQLAGGAGAGRGWRVGIGDPADRRRILATVDGRDLAVATSGSAERGPHIVNPFTGRPPSGLASVTVVGPSLVRADGYATAAFAMGAGALAWLEQVPGYEGLVVTETGDLRVTSGFSRWADVAGATRT
jgi:thiamine biosynthesis lipoprotein